MSINETNTVCTAPLLDESLFTKRGGYQSGRHCGLGSFQDGASEASCCFPCPIQDWVYPPGWQSHLRIPNYLSILSVVLCSFLLLSYLVLPPAQSHRHYLSMGLLIPVLMISLSFAIPVSTDPEYCYDAITPADMHNSMSCAWTGSLVTLGGLGCVIWVFLRSLWLFVRIVYDKAPGRNFRWGSIATGTLLPVIFLVAVLSSTGYSYRMGQTCLPNNENSIVTFWIWLVIFAILGFVLQFITTGYCVWIYIRTLRRERANPARLTYQSIDMHTRRTNLQAWANAKKLFLLQWRNILVSVFVLVGSLVFFVVFWTQDSKLERALHDPENIDQVKTWLACQVLNEGDKEECRKYVEDFTVDEPAILTALVLVSTVGIEIFILLFRRSMVHAWIALFKGLRARIGGGRPSTPELTSFENPEKYLLPETNGRRQGSGFIERLNISHSRSGSPGRNINRQQWPLLRSPPPPPPPPKDYPPPIPPTPPPHKYTRPCQPLLPPTSSTSSLILSPSLLPIQPTIHITSPTNTPTSSPAPASPALRPLPPPPRFQVRRHSLTPSRSRYHPTRPAPMPPSYKPSSRSHSPNSSIISISASVFSNASRETERTWRDSTLSALEHVLTEDEQAGANRVMGGGGLSGKRRGREGWREVRISAPVVGSFRHVDGAFVGGMGEEEMF